MYTLYRVTNKLNGRYYIGVHKTDNPNDRYLGSGRLIRKAVKRYGRDSFTKEILFTFNTAEDAYAKEAEIVNKQIIEDSNCYNLINGGSPSIEWMEERKAYYSRTFKTFLGKKHTGETKRKISEAGRGRIQSLETRQKRSNTLKALNKTSYWKGKSQPQEANAKRSLAHLNLSKVICPHCTKSISPQNAKRWHFENCKLNG